MMGFEQSPAAAAPLAARHPVDIVEASSMLDGKP